MMAAFTGLVIGAAGQVPVLMAGGTQMSAVLALINALQPDVLCNVAVGTTRWVAKDKSSDLKGIVKQFCDVPILAANLNFGLFTFPRVANLRDGSCEGRGRCWGRFDRCYGEAWRRCDG